MLLVFFSRGAPFSSNFYYDFASYVVQEESYPVLSETPMNFLKEMGNQIILNFKTKQYFNNIAKMRQNAL